MIARVRRIVADTLDLPYDEITVDFARDDGGQWDSIAHIMLMLAIEQEFDVKLTVNQLAAVQSITDICNVVTTCVGGRSIT